MNTCQIFNSVKKSKHGKVGSKKIQEIEYVEALEECQNKGKLQSWLMAFGP